MNIAFEVHLILEFIPSFILVMGADAGWWRAVIDVALRARLAHAFGLGEKLEWLYLHRIVRSR